VKVQNELYRFYDTDDVLLYIGISMTPWERFRQHREGKEWWNDIRTIRKEPYPDRDSVRAAERDAIVAEKPLYNVQHNGGVRKVMPRRSLLNGRRYSFLDRSGHERRGELHLSYEVDNDPISEDFNARWDSPHDVFDAWRERYLKARERSPLPYMARCVPITWFISGCATFESAHPGNYALYGEETHSWWGDFYTRPYDIQGQSFIGDVKDIPVLHKQWTAKRQDKGGFITEATGWKPFPLQRWVDLDQLTSLSVTARRQAS
jgi:hypothetical protein